MCHALTPSQTRLVCSAPRCTWQEPTPSTKARLLEDQPSCQGLRDATHMLVGCDCLATHFFSRAGKDTGARGTGRLHFYDVFVRTPPPLNSPRQATVLPEHTVCALSASQDAKCQVTAAPLVHQDYARFSGASTQCPLVGPKGKYNPTAYGSTVHST